MNAQKAIKISESNLPSVIDKKYKSIIESIERATKEGRTDVAFGFLPPCKEVIERLEQEGYWLYSIGDNWMFPKMYGVSWKVQEPKKKWYHRLFGEK
jgi:hypothetical protein